MGCAAYSRVRGIRENTVKKNTFHSFNHHIHNNELHTHFDVTILTVRLRKFTP
jgi:hypothetical protein